MGLRRFCTNTVMRLRYKKYFNWILIAIPIVLLVKVVLHYQSQYNTVNTVDPRRIKLADFKVNSNLSNGLNIKHDLHFEHSHGHNHEQRVVAAPPPALGNEANVPRQGVNRDPFIPNGQRVVHLEKNAGFNVHARETDTHISTDRENNKPSNERIEQNEEEEKPPQSRRGGGTCDNSKCNPTKEGMLNVHVVVHSHDDVGWKKTYMQYYNGQRPNMRESNYGGGECTRCILSSVIPELLKNPNRRFIFVEMAFFSLWFAEQKDTMKEDVRMLIRERRLELIVGGWCMSDSACTYYDDVIDQHTHGFQWIEKELGECGMPKSAWHLDQFGHSREHSSIFAQMGYDGLIVGRIDNWDQDRRMASKNMETIWRTSPDNLGSRTDLFTGVLYDGYFTPGGFRRSTINEISRKHMIASFNKLVKKRASVYQTNHLLIPYGGDFDLQYASSDYTFLDDLIRVVNAEQNNGSKVNLLYSTPTCYINNVNKEAPKLEAIQSDFFPYGIIPNTYWTGFFTSRPGLKRHVKTASSFLQACKMIAVMADLPDGYKKVAPLKEAVAVLQHHDAITGTEQQHVTNDYNKLLSDGENACRKVLSASYQSLLKTEKPIPDHRFCPSLNTSVCPVTEYYKTFSASLFNSLGWEVAEWVRLPVVAGEFVVTGPDGQVIPSQLLPLPASTTRIPERGLSKANAELLFQTSIPPVGFSVYTVKRIREAPIPEIAKQSENEDVVLSNQFLSLTVNGETGQTSQLKNLKSGISVAFVQSFLYYIGSSGERRISGDRRGGMGGFFGGHKRASGAYAFIPRENTPPVAVSESNKVKVKVVKTGNVQEVHQEFSNWASQVIRLYDGAPYLEMEWTVGPIPDKQLLTKEVISRFQTDINSQYMNANTWYTDSNGREMIRRRFNYHEPYPYNVTCPISGNYYPVTGRMFIRDEDRKIQLTVLTDRSQAGGSLSTGQMELLVHRRTFHDDDLGVEEPLNELGINGKGLIIRGKHYILLDTIEHSSRDYRPLGLQIHRPPYMSFMSEMEGKDMKTKGTLLKKSLSENIHLLTFDQTENNPDLLLLRLENYFEKSERSETATLNLDDHFPGIVNVRELSLGGNHNISEVRRLIWQTQDDLYTPAHIGSESTRVKLSPPYTVTLEPMEIRTFHITVNR